MLNDLIADRNRAGAFGAFASWLRSGGVLVADVRDWDGTVARYESAGARERRAGSLRYRTETALDRERGLMLITEWYGSERHELAMRPWTAGEVRACARAAGFASIDVRSGGEAGIAPDRLLIVARLG